MSAYSVAVLADSPDVYYRLNETGSGPFVDQIAAHNLTPDGTIVTDTALVPSDASVSAKLDYSTAFTTATSTYTLSQQPLTVEFWVKPAVLTGSSGGVSYVASCGAPGGWACGYVDTTGKWYFVSHSVIAETFNAAAVVGTTYYIVFVVGAVGNSIDLYVNGAFSQTLTPASPFGATTQTLQLGGDGAAAKPKATIAELAIYKSALSASRIAAHYAAGSSGSRNLLLTGVGS